MQSSTCKPPAHKRAGRQEQRADGDRGGKMIFPQTGTVGKKKEDGVGGAVREGHGLVEAMEKEPEQRE
jgi:hypothetical protein